MLTKNENGKLRPVRFSPLLPDPDYRKVTVKYPRNRQTERVNPQMLTKNENGKLRPVRFSPLLPDPDYRKVTTKYPRNRQTEAINPQVLNVDKSVGYKKQESVSDETQTSVEVKNNDFVANSPTESPIDENANVSGIDEELSRKIVDNTSVVSYESKNTISSKLYSLKGERLKDTEGSNSIRINKENLSPGGYVLMILDSGQILRKKFIVVR
jgi:hypothetical protein